MSDHEGLDGQDRRGPLMRCPLYAIGPITGRDGNNFAWWAEVALWCRRRGFPLLDARDHCGGDLHRQRPEYMRDSMRDVARAQSIILHPEWSLSAGAFMEWLTAYELALDMYLWPSMDLWPRADQDHVATLLRHALAAIVESRGAGAGKHGVDSYLSEPLVHHLTVGRDHAQRAKDIARGDRLDDGEDHVARALCREAMAMATRCSQNGNASARDIEHE